MEGKDRMLEGHNQASHEAQSDAQTPATPVPTPSKVIVPGSIPPLELSSSAAPQSAKESIVARVLPLHDLDPARTPTSEGHPFGHAVRATTDPDTAQAAVGEDAARYFASKSALRESSSSQIASTDSTSNTSSPLHSGHASWTSFQSSQADSTSAGDFDELSSGQPEDLSFTSSPISRTASNAVDTSSDTTSTTKRQSSPQLRRDGPHYPNQSFAALQSQYYPPSYEPHPLRTRSSHPSQSSFYSSTSSTQSRSFSSVTSGAKTAGNTPAQSPGLFTADSPKHRLTDDGVKEAPYSTPMLHHTHLHAPKETHKLLKDIDPISGRKIVNNYEFQSKLGSGAHGTVKLGRNLEGGNYVAIKIVRRFSKKLRLGKQESPEDKVKKEVAILKKARHPHVVSLLEVIDDPEFGKVYLILEYVELGEIVWRSNADKNIAIFEMNRVKREMSGNYDEAAEAEAIAAFTKDLQARREEKQRLLCELHSQIDEPLVSRTTTSTEAMPSEQNPYWSLEHGGEADDDHNRSLRVLGRPDMAKDEGSSSLEELLRGPFRHGSSSRISTPIPEETAESVIPAAQFASFSGAHVSPMASPAIVDGNVSGNVWDSYKMGPNDQLAYQTNLDRTLSSQSHELGTEEEYKHIPCLTLSQALDAFRDTVLGLEYLHYQGIIHRDIKPANLLWNADHRVKISDFGVSYLGRPIREDDNNEEIEEADAANLDEAIELAKTVGTPAFYAPELCDPDLFDFDKTPERPQITGQIDVWALGVTLYGMIFGRLPFFDDNEFAMYEKIARQEVFIPRRRLKGVETTSIAPLSINKRLDDDLEYEDVDDELQDLLRRLLQKKPSKRITLKEVKHHPWVLRGIKDQSKWIDDTDPSLQSQGKKIEVSTQEVNEAVAPLTIVDRIKSGIRRLGSVVRGRDSRKRAESSSKSGEASVGDRQGRRTSLRGDEQIFSALRASRENADHHPLAQSLAASPEIREDQAYFPGTAMENIPFPSPKAQRPKLSERTISTAESTKTIKPTVPTTVVRQSTPPLATESLPSIRSYGDSAASSSSSLTGIFGGAGRRLVRGMRSRERGADREGASESSRSSSVENMASNFEDPHASPSIAFSTAIAAGHVDQPPIPNDTAIIQPQPRYAPVIEPTIPGNPYVDAFQKAQEENYRKLLQEHEREQHAEQARQQRSRANTAVQCPPSPDDEIAYEQQQRRQSQTSQEAHMAVSSSDDHMTSGISESFSHPSIPSVVSGASSLATTAEELKADSTSSMMSTGRTITTANLGKVPSSISHDDDEAGYNGDGDGDEEEEESDDDGGIMFGRK